MAKAKLSSAERDRFSRLIREALLGEKNASTAAVLADDDETYRLKYRERELAVDALFGALYDVLEVVPAEGSR